MNGTAPRTRLLVVDDQAIVRQGLVALLRMRPEVDVVGEAEDGAEAIELHARLLPDVTLMDVRMPRVSGVAAVHAIRQTHPTARILMLSTYDDEEDVRRALQAGAGGFMLKDVEADALIEAIRAVHAGRRRLSPELAERTFTSYDDRSLTARELDVLRAMARGQTNKEIAGALDISESTVKGHVNHILTKLAVSGRTEAVVAALKTGMVKLE